MCSGKREGESERYFHVLKKLCQILFNRFYIYVFLEKEKEKAKGISKL